MIRSFCPGQPGKSHLHQFIGNTAADANSTYQSLRTKGGSTCDNRSTPDKAFNRSAYWMPAMLDGEGNAIRPDYALVYYKRIPAGQPGLRRSRRDPHRLLHRHAERHQVHLRLRHEDDDRRADGERAGTATERFSTVTSSQQRRRSGCAWTLSQYRRSRCCRMPCGIAPADLDHAADLLGRQDHRRGRPSQQMSSMLTGQWYVRPASAPARPTIPITCRTWPISGIFTTNAAFVARQLATVERRHDAAR